MPSLEGPAAKLAQSLRHEFNDAALLLQALTHRSYRNERPALAPLDNERLEFLGDAVLDLAVAAMLCEAFPEAGEGELTRRRADLVSEAGLANVARSIDLGAALLLGRGEENSGGRDKPRLLASALEACVGAVFLDGGWRAAEALARALFADASEAPDSGRRDSKSRAQEWAQAAFGSTPRYRVLAEIGPDHERRFVVALALNDEEVATGEGRSKAEAEQAAAAAALASWQSD